MLSNIGGPTLLVILFIVLLLFGAPKLPALARSLGQSMKILKKEVSTKEEGASAAAEADAGQPAAAAPAAPAAPAAQPVSAPQDEAAQQLAQAKLEAEAARSEADALRAAAEKRAREGS